MDHHDVRRVAALLWKEKLQSGPKAKAEILPLLLSVLKALNLAKAAELCLKELEAADKASFDSVTAQVHGLDGSVAFAAISKMLTPSLGGRERIDFSHKARNGHRESISVPRDPGTSISTFDSDVGYLGRAMHELFTPMTSEVTSAWDAGFQFFHPPPPPPPPPRHRRDASSHCTATATAAIAVISSDDAPIFVGNAMPLDKVHGIEMQPGFGGQIARAAGSSATVLSRDQRYVTVQMPSREVRLIKKESWCTIGKVGRPEAQLIKLGKAGKKRHLGFTPHVRGSAKNAADHAHGGGEGRSPIGHRHPKTKFGKCAHGLRTRRTQYSDRMILIHRKKKSWSNVSPHQDGIVRASRAGQCWVY
eukprot:s3522_g7.t1